MSKKLQRGGGAGRGARAGGVHTLPGVLLEPPQEGNPSEKAKRELINSPLKKLKCDTTQIFLFCLAGANNNKTLKHRRKSTLAPKDIAIDFDHQHAALTLHVNGSALLMIYHIVTKYEREVAASAGVFRPVSQSSAYLLPFSLSIISIPPLSDTPLSSKRPAVHW
ncbi:hypothetical protein EVAR_22031_1 [Eumeta japonica]|uniref:Uncharacterized protein n=1 Tax=Eumeta variegata TaxID=151549 RepID=A0A4C1USY2_EUMVA|nr:hypothetical protein EVAR_22031_1 [Eumeta japonica]